MTAIANVGIADTQQPTCTPPPFPVATIGAGPGSSGFMPSGIFCIGALTASDGQFLYLSLIGRDTAFQEMRGKMTAGQLNSFVIRQDGVQVASGWFSREWLGSLEYHGAKLQTDLFGEVSQMILYHSILTTPDKATQKAVYPFMVGVDKEGVDGLLDGISHASATWGLVKHICPIPLMDEWEKPVVKLLVDMGWY